MRPLRLPVGAKRRGNLIQAVPNSPKSSKISKQFCEIATAASGLAMTKSDFFDNLIGGVLWRPLGYVWAVGAQVGKGRGLRIAASLCSDRQAEWPHP